MRKNNVVAKQLDQKAIAEPTAAQVASYLESHPDFFVDHQSLLAELTLPHESGDAVSLLERQVSILRNRGQDARLKLSRLLDNARDNDLLFETTRDIVLALLKSRDIAETIQVTEDKLRAQETVDTCELILLENKFPAVADGVRTEKESALQGMFADVFRLKRTHCGLLIDEQLDYLFNESKSGINSTALCPIMINTEIFGLLAIGNQQENYFNVDLDTLFLDFIGNVVGAVLSRQI